MNQSSATKGKQSADLSTKNQKPASEKTSATRRKMSVYKLTKSVFHPHSNTVRLTDVPIICSK